MRNKKLLTFLFSLTMVSSLVYCVGCSGKGGGKEDGGEPGNKPTPEVSIETLSEIPQTDVTLTALATGEATSSWFFEYGESGLELTVYVLDAAIYNSGNIYYNDHIEIILDKAQDENGYSEKTVSVSVDAAGTVAVLNLHSETAVEDSGVVASVKHFTLSEDTENGADGWYANVTVPYALTGISAEKKDAAVCIGMTNADGKTALSTAYHEGIDTDAKSVKTYMHLADDNRLERNPYYYQKVDGVTLDGVRDEAYGAFTDRVTLDGDRWYTVSAVKTENGVAVYSQALFNTTSVNEAETDWGLNTNFEFTLGGGSTSYVALNGLHKNVSNVKTDIEKTADGKYLHTVEFFVEKSLIKGWATGDVQLNYGWKSPNENAFMTSNMIDYRYTDWDTDTHNYQRLGGLSDYTFDDERVPAPANLFITANGLTVESAPLGENFPIVDGDLSEYGEADIIRGDKNRATVALSGKVVNGNLYLAFTITHGEWAAYSTSWWLNDNIEMKIGNETFRVVFFGGELMIPANVTEGVAQTVSENGKLVTTVELCIAGEADSYDVKIGIAGNGFKDWQSILWDGADCLYVDETGASADYRVDGLVIDGVRDEAYGAFIDRVTLDGDRWYTISAVKTENGVAVYSQALFNTTTVDPSDWGKSTNFEFKLNDGETSFVAYNGLVGNVSLVKTNVEKTADGKYLHTVEFYVESSLINNWSRGDVLLNYGWKSPGENALMLSDMIDCRYTDWNTDTHNYQRLGGLSDYTFDGEHVSPPVNLMILENGLKVNGIPEGEGLPIVDGDLSEYGEADIIRGDENKATVALNGKVVNRNLYLAFTITHGKWAAYSTSWWLNDNIEMKIFDLPVRILFLNGELNLPATVTDGAAKTVSENGKQITTVELCFAFNTNAYEVKIGIAGNGFMGWQSILWDGADCLYVDETGASDDLHMDGIVFDGAFSEAAWTDSMKENAIETTANGATITVMGKKAEKGILFGVTVIHTKAPDVSVEGSDEPWAYMGVELYFNGNPTLYRATCRNERTEKVYSQCKTVENGDGTYTSTFEIYILYAEAEIPGTEQIAFSMGGWYETDWAWLWGGNTTTNTHVVTENGIQALPQA